MGGNIPKKIAFVANASKEMYIFRGDVIKYFKEKGYDITVIVPFSEENYNYNNVKEIFLPLDRKGTNPIKDYLYYRRLKSIYKKEKFDIIFHYTIKPNIYGTLAAHKTNTKSIAVTTGLGYVFLYNDFKSKIAKFLYKYNLKYADKIWFLNQDDKNDFVNNNITTEQKSFVLPGEGINLEYFKPLEKDRKDQKTVFLLIARLLKDKGLYEYIEVAKRIKNKYSNVEFQILGSLDKGNPSCIDESILIENIKDNTISYFGVTNDVRKYIKEVDVVVLPSYREGISRTLMEAMSMEKPIITTNVIGCKDLVKDGYNGFICESKNIESLENAIIKFINLSNVQRNKQGKKGREFVKKEYDIERIINIYQREIENINPKKN